MMGWKAKGNGELPPELPNWSRRQSQFLNLGWLSEVGAAYSGGVARSDNRLIDYRHAPPSGTHPARYFEE